MIDPKLLAYIEHCAMGRLVAIQEARMWLRLGVHGQAFQDVLGHAEDLHEVLSDYERDLEQISLAGGRSALDDHRMIGLQLGVVTDMIAAAVTDRVVDKIYSHCRK